MAAEDPKALARPVTQLQQSFTRLRFLLALPLGVVLLYFVQHGPLWPGVVVALFGELWQVWAASHLHKNVTMVRSGPYALVRNPMYFGRFFVLLGFVLLTWRWYFIVGYVLIFALYAQARVLGEEARLRGLFGEEYADYCRRVNRWFPWPKGGSDGRRWSWEAVQRNHQLRVSLAVVLLLALLWWRVQSPATFGLGH